MKKEMTASALICMRRIPLLKEPSIRARNNQYDFSRGIDFTLELKVKKRTLPKLLYLLKHNKEMAIEYSDNTTTTFYYKPELICEIGEDYCKLMFDFYHHSYNEIDL